MANSIEIARAYVTIVPSMKNSQDAITKELVPAAEKAAEKAGKQAGSTLGDKLKDGLKKAGKGIASALGDAVKSATKAIAAGVTAVTGAAFAGITALTKQAISSFADYEQLVGGVEKIFDKLDTSAILADANQAYKNLNMSANEYLETINSVGAAFSSTMGDKKGYETAKLGMQAIADFASGTGRSVQELNEKYKAITRSTGSYQSIADQFSGILPATSEAFLKQAQAAGLLSKKYGKLTEVPLAEYQEAVTKMLEKGVDQLGLTGNTAKEALNTISGSIASTKGAWSNFVTSLASGEDIEGRLADLKESIFGVEGASNGLLNNILPVVKEVIKNIGVAVKQFIPELVNLLPDVLEAITDIFDAIVDVLPETFTTIMTAIVGILPMLFEAVINTIVALVPTIVNLLPDILNALLVLLEQIIAAIPQIMPALIDGLIILISTLIEALPELIPQIITGLVTMFVLLVSRIGEIIQPIIDNLPVIIYSIMDALMENLPLFLAGLWSLINGIIEAIPDLVYAIIDTIVLLLTKLWVEWIGPALAEVGEFFTNIWNKITEIFSKLGEWFNTNVIQPITNFFSNLWANISNAASIAWNAVKNTWTVVKNWFNDNVITPVANFFSGIWNSIKTGASNAWEGIKGVFTSIPEWFKNIFSNAWQKVKDVFSTGGKIFDGIKDGIVNAFKTVVNAIIRGINKVISVPFNAINSVLTKLKGIEILGLKPFGWVNTFNVPQIPELALGGIINKATLSIIGERGPEAVVPLSENSKWINKVAESILNKVTVPASSTQAVRIQDSKISRSSNNNISINVYGAEGQSEDRLADIILEKLQVAITKQEVVYA